MRSFVRWLLRNPRGRGELWFRLASGAVVAAVCAVFGWLTSTVIAVIVGLEVVDLVTSYVWWRRDRRRERHQAVTDPP
ncbi:hypothetical protein [Saccharothrix hoggarensis]|uniref:DUF2061 domain-containing protein n=1 Tax=Saccharothrix hoggarensis TaxID=913853 RepID=A0ABW3R1N1_9PSEU